MSGTAVAQETKPADPLIAALAAIPAPAPEDVRSIDSIVTAVYDVISGDQGVKRDWNRFQSLFYPGARMIPSSIHPVTKKAGARVITPADYMKSSGPFLEGEGFQEVEIARRVEQYGTIAHVFSTYDGRLKKSGRAVRGINSIQLFNDGKRWWVLTIAWSQESPEQPIPEAYLKSPK